MLRGVWWMVCGFSVFTVLLRLVALAGFSGSACHVLLCVEPANTAGIAGPNSRLT